MNFTTENINFTTEPLIKVCIVEDTEVSFDLNGRFYSVDAERVFYGFQTAKIKDDVIEITDQTGSVYKTQEISFEPNDYETDTVLIKNVEIGKKFHWERKEHERFRGSLKLQLIQGKIQAINIIPAEDYLLSVISSEMSATSSEELLRAHAIVSRSWLLSQIKRENPKFVEAKKENIKIIDNELIKWYDQHDHQYYDVCADDHCQRYQGITKAYTKRVKRAIRDTRGTILEYNGEICDTRYSKCCGGITESFENVWNNVNYPYLQSVEDCKFPADNVNLDFSSEATAERWISSNPSAFCNTNDKVILSQVLNDYDQSTNNFFRWQVSYTQDELADLIKRKTGIDFGSIIDLKPVERGHSSRLVKLMIIGTKYTLTVGKELEIRRILSESHLMSSAFIVIKEDISENIPEKFTLKGAGWGHGVGLCQIGAAVMGAMGFKFDEILTHYFKDAVIRRIYD
ncbi:MAG: SpoIID/LytB domain-containing protein [Ignavibacteria bacterium]|nr:SpoIID/LytB domain-containing protein [Ignavibacteria bacterium]